MLLHDTRAERSGAHASAGSLTRRHEDEAELKESSATWGSHLEERYPSHEEIASSALWFRHRTGVRCQCTSRHEYAGLLNHRPPRNDRFYNPQRGW